MRAPLDGTLGRRVARGVVAVLIGLAPTLEGCGGQAEPPREVTFSGDTGGGGALGGGDEPVANEDVGNDAVATVPDSGSGGAQSAGASNGSVVSAVVAPASPAVPEGGSGGAESAGASNGSVVPAVVAPASPAVAVELGCSSVVPEPGSACSTDEVCEFPVGATTDTAVTAVASCQSGQWRVRKVVRTAPSESACTIAGTWLLKTTGPEAVPLSAPSINLQPFIIEVDEAGAYWIDLWGQLPWDTWEFWWDGVNCGLTASGSDSRIDLSVAPAGSTCGLRSWRDSLELAVVDETTATGLREVVETAGCLGTTTYQTEVTATRPAQPVSPDSATLSGQAGAAGAATQ